MFFMIQHRFFFVFCPASSIKPSLINIQFSLTGHFANELLEYREINVAELLNGLSLVLTKNAFYIDVILPYFTDLSTF